MVLAGILGLANAQNNSITEGHVQSATTICRVLGDGRKVETVVLQYDTPIRNKSLSAESFTVEGKDGLSGKNMGKEFQNDGAFPVIFH